MQRSTTRWQQYDTRNWRLIFSKNEGITDQRGSELARHYYGRPLCGGYTINKIRVSYRYSRI